MFKKKKQVDVTEFELIKIRVKNLEKQLFELEKEKGITEIDKEGVSIKVNKKETIQETTIITDTKIIKIFGDSITIQTKDGIEIERFKLAPQTEAEELVFS